MAAAVQENPVAQVDHRPRRLAQNENRITEMDGIAEQRHAAGQAQVPERPGNVAAPRSFAGDPLVQEPRCENRLPAQANRQSCQLDGGQGHQSLKVLNHVASPPSRSETVGVEKPQPRMTRRVRTTANGHVLPTSFGVPMHAQIP